MGTQFGRGPDSVLCQSSAAAPGPARCENSRPFPSPAAPLPPQDWLQFVGLPLPPIWTQAPSLPPPLQALPPHPSLSQDLFFLQNSNSQPHTLSSPVFMTNT